MISFYLIYRSKKQLNHCKVNTTAASGALITLEFSDFPTRSIVVLFTTARHHYVITGF
jgi:hypothetical protein